MRGLPSFCESDHLYFDVAANAPSSSPYGPNAPLAHPMEMTIPMTLLRPTFTTLAALAAAALAPMLAHAQQQQGSPPPSAPAASTTAATPVNTAAEQAIKQMTNKLRNVLAAQEGHYSDHGTYTSSMTSLGRYDSGLAPAKMNSPRRGDSVSVQVIFAGGRGWTGIASHWGLRGRSCVVYVGIAEELPKLPITRADRRTPTEEGVPMCDSAPAPTGGTAPSPAAPPATAPAQPPMRQ